MSDPAPRRMTVAEFLEWELEQEWRHELVNGQPRAMTGARFSHDLVVGNFSSALRVRLRASSSPCNVFGADIAVIVPNGNVRRPDVAVHCPPFDYQATESDRPRLVAEVLSDSTQAIDQRVKLDEYQAIPELDYILFIAPTRCEVGVWSRDLDRRWRQTVHHAADAVIALDGLGVSLPLSDIYEQAPLREGSGPRLVRPDDDALP